MPNNGVLVVVVVVFCFLVGLEFELRTYILSHSTSPFFVMGFLR
jgi:hypothetical protein